MKSRSISKSTTMVNYYKFILFTPLGCSLFNCMLKDLKWLPVANTIWKGYVFRHVADCVQGGCLGPGIGYRFWRGWHEGGQHDKLGVKEGGQGPGGFIAAYIEAYPHKHTATDAGITHPTGIHSSYEISYLLLISHKKLIIYKNIWMLCYLIYFRALSVKLK